MRDFGTTGAAAITVVMPDDIHEVAASGFQRAPDAYDRGRPEYPMDAVEHLVRELRIGNASCVLELGAGTGKFTKLLASLVPTGVKVIAIEPVDGMRDKFASLLPAVEVLAGTAERIPLAADSVDAVVVAQAFQWFDGRAALQEIHRVLKPEGRLGLIWNIVDDSLDWVAKMEGLIRQREKNHPTYKSGEWRKAFEQTELFTPLQVWHSRYTQVGEHETLVNRAASLSFIAAMPEAERRSLLEEVRQLLSTHPQTKGRNTIELSYRTDCFWCRSTKRG